MPPRVRLFGTDREEIVDLESWFVHAPPEGGLPEWRDGYTAKEQAKAWLRPGRPGVPEEFWSGIQGFVGDSDELYGRPEHATRLDWHFPARRHDLFACPRRDGVTSLVIGVEAKACEGFDGKVAEHGRANEPGSGRARCNLLARALFNRSVFDEQTGDVLDEGLASQGYRLWTAAVGTIIEAQARGVPDALLVVHQFQPSDLFAAAQRGDERGWRVALAASAVAIDAFTSVLGAAGSESHESPFVRSGTTIRVIKVDTSFNG